MPKKISHFDQAIAKCSSTDFKDIRHAYILLETLENQEQVRTCLDALYKGKDQQYLSLLLTYAVATSGQLEHKIDLDLSETQLPPDIGFIKYLPQLKKVNLGYWKGLEDITALENLQELTELRVGSDSLTNIDSLSKLVALRILDLSNCDILSDLRAIGNLENLESLTFFNCYSINKIEALKKLRNLKQLNLHGSTFLKTLKGIENLHQLKKLDLTCCESLQKIDQIENLINLEILSLGWCENLRSLEHIRNLSNLRELDVSCCAKIDDFDILENLVFLKKLDLSNTEIKNLESLIPLRNLEELVIFNSTPSDTTPLKYLKNLRTLELSGYQWKEKIDLSFLLETTQLTEFKLSSNSGKYATIDSIPSSSSIESFSIEGSNSRFDLALINNLTNLKKLTLRSLVIEGDFYALLENIYLEELVFNGCSDLKYFSQALTHPSLKKVEFIHCKPIDVDELNKINPSIEIKFH